MRDAIDLHDPLLEVSPFVRGVFGGGSNSFVEVVVYYRARRRTFRSSAAWESACVFVEKVMLDTCMAVVIAEKLFGFVFVATRDESSRKADFLNCFQLLLSWIKPRRSARIAKTFRVGSTHRF